MDVDKLEVFGLSNKHAKVYLALLELGTAFVSEIGKKAGINRSTAYMILEELLKRGLVSSSDEYAKRQYKAESLEKLLGILEERARHISDDIHRAQKEVLPELKSLCNKPRVKFYEGTEGLISVYEDTLTSTETILAYASIENMHAALGDYFPSYYKRRAGKEIFIRSIHPDTPEARERVSHDREEARDSALIPHKEYSFSPEINIYDSKLVFMSLREKFGLIIESEELASAMKKVFELSWKEAKRLDKRVRNKKIKK